MRKNLLALLLFLCTFVSVYSQNRTITGTVTDKNDGSALPGVSVLVKGLRTGTQTDRAGRYSISVPAGQQSLLFSFIGYTTLTVPATGTVVNAALQTDARQLSEVVVTGYGVQRRGEANGSTSTITAAELADKPTQSFEQSLGGRAPGVQITVPNAVLNAPPVFRIRGTNSISLSSQPLIVVDGIVVQTGDFSSTSAGGNALASINPNDIESIDIGKDAAATAIYGSRAANGVVFVTTKKGKVGAPKISYSGWVGSTKPTRLPDLLDAFQYTDYKNEAVANTNAIRPNTAVVSAGNPVVFKLTNDANGNPINTNWYDVIYRTGVSQNHNLSISGGTEATKYYLGAGYTNQEGIIQKNDFKRANAVLNLDSKVSKYLSVGGKLSYSDEKNLAAVSSGSLAGEAYGTAGLGRLALVTAPSVSSYNLDGSYNYGALYIGPMNNILVGNQPGFYNPDYILNNNRSNSYDGHLQSNIFGTLTPFSWLNIRSTYGVDYLNVDNEIFQAPLHGDGQTAAGSATSSLGKYRSWTFTNTIQADHTFGKHTVGVLGGNEQQRRTQLGFGINRTGLSDLAFQVIQAGYTTNNSTGQSLTENYLVSFFGRLNYDFDKKYFIGGNIRQDEYSALGIKRGVFYGVSAGWEITKESFWTSAGLDKVFSSFKLRGSYGKVGNISGIGSYDSYSTFGAGLYGGNPTLVYNNAGNNQVTWETSKKTDVGFNMGLFNDRLTLTAAYYKNNIDGLIINVPEAPSTGVPTSISKNAGSMYNKGLELEIGGIPVQTRNFSWNSSFNFTHNKNEVTALAPGLTQLTYLTGSGATGESPNRTIPGYSVGYLWVVRTGGVDPATGRRIFYDSQGRAVTYQHITPFVTGSTTVVEANWKYMDGSTAPAISQGADAVMYKPNQPKVYGGFDNTFRFKGLDLNVLLTYQFGGYIHYGTNAGLHDQRFWNNTVDVLGRWKAPGDVTNFVKPIYTDNVSYGNTIPIDFNVFKSDFVKVRNIQLGYTLPKTWMSKAKINSARLYVSGQNLLIITDYPGPDPEVSSNGTSSQGQGSDRNTAANGRVLTLGVNIGF